MMRSACAPPANPLSLELPLWPPFEPQISDPGRACATLPGRFTESQPTPFNDIPRESQYVAVYLHIT